MTGKLIIDIPQTEPHVCDTPETSIGMDCVRFACSHGHGTLWRCHCGRHWEVRGRTWEPISDRRARRIIRRRHRQETR